MSDIAIPPLGYSPEPPRPHRVVIAFDVLARTQAEAQHMVDEVLIEELAGPPNQLRTDGDRVFGEDFGDHVPHIRSWEPAVDSSHSPAARVVPSPGWEPFDGSGFPEIVAEMFPPEPAAGDFRLPDGTPDREGFEDAHERWRDECLSLAVQASRLPEALDRLERAERVRDGLMDLLERERLPVEPVKEDYLVAVAPSFEGEYEDMRFRSDHAQWRSEFTATALRREHGLQGLLAEGGPRTMFLPERFHREWVPSDLIALQTLRVLVERETAGEGKPLLDRREREELSAMLFAADPDIRVVDPDDPAGAELYAGQASQAHDWMPPGVYDATGYDRTGQFRLVVGRVPVGDGVMASAAFAPAEHDSAVVNEIARILEQDTEQHDPAIILARINAAVLGTGRTAATPSDIRPPEQALTRLERGALLSELLAEREQHLDTDPDGPEPPTLGRGPGRNL